MLDFIAQTIRLLVTCAFWPVSTLWGWRKIRISENRRGERIAWGFFLLGIPLGIIVILAGFPNPLGLLGLGNLIRVYLTGATLMLATKILQHVARTREINTHGAVGATFVLCFGILGFLLPFGFSMLVAYLLAMSH